MAKIQAVWALDVGQAALKALKLVPSETDDKVVAEAFDYVEYPKILSQPDADADQLVREALATFLERNDIKGCRVAIAVPGQAGLVKFIKLPPVEKKRIPDIVKFEARQQIPFALEEVIWDYQQIGDEEEGSDEEFTMAEVGLFAMKRDQINRAILPFTVAGIEVDIVQMGPISLYNYITFDRLKAAAADKGAEKGAVVLIDIGADNTDLIITDGTRIWQRNVPIGGNHFTRGLTKELKLTFAKGEHLKRNATKAPDPRAVFTAMRGVFNDLASEINRSIGFYSSVNRTTKILKVVGLGNGFKLPGLQKFLQQNLSHEVEKLETFDRLVGEEIVSAPQFQENLPSFAVAYGLGLQGLAKSQLRTNLLPPEMEQVRMIRRKKPWALAASVLLMLGFSALFIGDWKLWAKVNNPALQDATKEADRVSGDGGRFKTEFEAAKQVWTDEKSVGDRLVVNTSEQSRWPAFLQILNAYLPNPSRDHNLDPNNTSTKTLLDKLRVHVDAIKPVWRNDVGADWFNSPQLPAIAKDFMHPYDRANPPSGKGWVIQLIGHHYNPYPTAKNKGPDAKFDLGPLKYIVQVILPQLWHPDLRRFGIHHATLTWFNKDASWTTDKELASNGLPANVPLLPKAEPPKAAEAGATSTGGGGAYSQASTSGAAQYGGMGGGAGANAYAGGGGGAGAARYGGMPGTGQFGGASSDASKNVTTLTRTDFVIQLVWQPITPEPGKEPESRDEIRAKLKKAEDETKGSLKVSESDEAKLESLSKAASATAAEREKRAREAAEKAASGEPAGNATPSTSGATPSAPAPAKGTTPAAAPPPAAATTPAKK
ncbi:MAG TPA: type IV pilus assembly protein PilM [Isosphaeraceae bacterium]|jgi:type IV pilus assembly protein PilM|nr:type IV pilus assembly protein PilM [Isosphaeraceae bacterium]